MINKFTPSVDQNYWLKRLDTLDLELTIKSNKTTQSFWANE